MVQKEAKRRGRPPAYDPQAALAAAMKAFWKAGYAATSLDDLSAATGMNRPSLYGAFGDKRELYLKALAHYWGAGQVSMTEALAGDRLLREALAGLYGKALDLYFSGKGGARGCFLIGTALTESVGNAEVRGYMAEVLRQIDEAFEVNCPVTPIRWRSHDSLRRRCIRWRSARAPALRAASSTSSRRAR
jgi:AcrR family transcriptional regulator